MNYLELARRVARESGTVPGENQPASVVGATGRLGKIAAWTNTAWEDIQRERKDWLWMEGDGTVTTVVGVDAYDPITRQRAMIATREYGAASGVTCYKASDGVANEGHLRWLPWPVWRERFVVGPQVNGSPEYVSEDPQGRMRIGPAPDAEYVIRFRYRKTPQSLSTDSDTPEMPAAHHIAIVWTALIYLGTDDEATGQLALWERFRTRAMHDLYREQTPPLSFASDFA